MASGDLTRVQLEPIMDDYITKGFTTYVKWTCPKCGERVTSTEPNTIHMRGYKHEEKQDGSACGQVYHGDAFGLMAVMEFPI